MSLTEQRLRNPRRRPGVVLCRRGGDLMLVPVGHTEGFVINSSACSIWRLCDARSTATDIARQLEATLRLPSGALDVDVEGAIEALARAGVVELVPPPPAAGLAWERLAPPAEDLSDLQGALSLFEARHGTSWRLAADEFARHPTILEGRVTVRVCHAKTSKGLVAAPPDHPNLAAAAAFLRRWPTGYRQVQALVHSFHPVLDPGLPDDARGFMRGSHCHSDDGPASLGRMWSTINCPLFLAENFVHELAHQKLFALGLRKESCDRLIANPPEEGFQSPVITDRPRPMTALVHGVYAYMYVARFDLALLEDEPEGERRQRLLERLGTNLGRLEEGRAEMLPHRRTDAEGARFFVGFDLWLDELIAQGRALCGARPRSAPKAKAAKVAPAAHGLEPVRVFVGTDPRQGMAEQALEHSIRAHTRGPVEVVWMDYGRGGPWAGWEIGRKRGEVPDGPSAGWATEFSCFRFAIPEVAGFRGRALYLDSDMLVLGDLRELFETKMSAPWLVTKACNAAMLVDCGQLRGLDWWPSLQTMKTSGWNMDRYLELLRAHGALGSLPERWNCHDGKRYVAGETAVLHFTTRRTQPWAPYGERLGFQPHARSELTDLWWRTYLEARGRLRPSAESPSHAHAHGLERWRRLHAAAATLDDESLRASVLGLGILAHAARIGELVRSSGAARLLDFGSGQGWQYARPCDVVEPAIRRRLAQALGSSPSLSEHWGVERPVCHDPAFGPFASPVDGAFDGVLCSHVLEECPEEDLDWILAQLCARARRFVFCAVRADGPHLGAPGDLGTRRPEPWWRQRIERARQRHPKVHLELAVVRGDPGARP